MRKWILPALVDKFDSAEPTEEGSVTNSIGSRDCSVPLVDDIERVTK